MSWVCPHCGTVATLQSSDYEHGKASEMIRTAPDNEGICFRWQAIRCPSKSCGKYVVDLWTEFGVAVKYPSNGQRTGEVQPDRTRPFGLGHVRIEPRVGAPLSPHVPKVVKDDYEEAYLIKDLSPKAAATLCRRALQGMIRDFWQVTRPTLAQELKAIEAQCDADLYAAMMGLKGIGNIGAHPERDINLVVDVEEGEVEALLELLRILDKDWYVAKANKAASLAKVVALGAAKAAAQNPSAVASPAPPALP